MNLVFCLNKIYHLNQNERNDFSLLQKRIDFILLVFFSSVCIYYCSYLDCPWTISSKMSAYITVVCAELCLALPQQ